MNNTIELTGKIIFEPEDKTKKHSAQSSWKRVAMVLFNGDICEYYGWFINRRFNLSLIKPLRNAHITFINDSMKDLSGNGAKTLEEIDAAWEATKKKWNNKKITIKLSLIPHSNGEHWWLIIPHEDRDELQSIRAELGLGKPFFGFHMSIGHVNDKNRRHSHYVYDLLQNGV